jgi:hypothetical protein
MRRTNGSKGIPTNTDKYRQDEQSKHLQEVSDKSFAKLALDQRIERQLRHKEDMIETSNTPYRQNRMQLSSIFIVMARDPN